MKEWGVKLALWSWYAHEKSKPVISLVGHVLSHVYYNKLYITDRVPRALHNAETIRIR